MLEKYGCFVGLGTTYYPFSLLRWSLLEIEALKIVVPILQKEIEFSLKEYDNRSLHWGFSPIWKLIHEKTNVIENFKVC